MNFFPAPNPILVKPTFLSVIPTLALALVLLLAPPARAQESTPPPPTLHPALFLVGDSIMKTGTGNGERGPWGWGSEIIPFFNPAKIHVYNEGRGGRSSRGYIEEGAWAKLLERMQPGDFVLIQFGHNDAANSQNYPDRISLKGSGDETQEIESPVTHQKKTIHTYGWYLRQYVKDAKAKGATPIICSPVPRNTWIAGKIKRGFDGYAQWAADAAKMSGALFIDLNNIAADRYDALGQEKTAQYFADSQHTTKAGARLNAEAVVEGIKQLKDRRLANALAPVTPALDSGPASPTADGKPALPALYVLGDSTAANNIRTPDTIQGWGTPFLTYFDPAKINVVNAAKGGRSSRTFITEGSLDAVLAQLKPGDIVLVQFGHNDVFAINDATRARGTLHGIGEESEEIDNKITGKREVVHTYGWYMRKFVSDIRAKGASPIILTLTIRYRWNKDGTIERLPEPNLDLSNTNRFTAPSIYSIWAAEVAKAMHVPLIDVHNMIADRYEKEGKDIVSTYFNNPGDPTHTNPRGAEVNASIVLAGLKALKGPAFDVYLSAKGRAVPAADAKYIFSNVPTATTTSATAPAQVAPQPFEFKGNLDEQRDSPKPPRTGKVLLVLAGDSTVTYSAGYAAGFRSHLDKRLQVINLSRGGRTTATFRSDGRWQQALELKPDYVMIQFGHNDEGVMSVTTYAENLSRFVDEARAAGIKPILVTPISRYWRDDGRIHSELGPFVEAMKKVAADKQVPLMDMHARSIEYYERVGKEVTDTWSYTKPNPALARVADPSTLPATVLDYTHFNPAGSRAMGPVVADELKRAVPELAQYIY